MLLLLQPGLLLCLLVSALLIPAEIYGLQKVFETRLSDLALRRLQELLKRSFKFNDGNVHLAPRYRRLEQAALVKEHIHLAQSDNDPVKFAAL